MYWNDVASQVPEDSELVLVQKGEIIDFAHFDASGRRFVLRNGETFRLSEEIRWMELVRPSPFLKL